MDDKIIATFCLCDDLLKALHHQEDRQCQMNDAEVMTTAFIAALFFRGNHESARAMLKQYGYIPYMVSKSRFSRRLHRIKDICIIFFNMLANIWKTLNKDAIYVIDSLPIAVCDNIRIRRSKIYTKEEFRGYQASKKRYVYGLKIHLMVTQDGKPIECFLTPGSFGDVDALKYYAYELPYGTIIYADKAYNDYEIEDLLQEVEHITLIPIRKKTRTELCHRL
jgi:DDE family transposase